MNPIIEGTVFEDGSAWILLRVVGQDGEEITQASLSTITYAVTDLADDSEIVAATAVAISSTVYDTLQTDARWSADDDGYNFAHALGPTTFPRPGRYRVEYIFTPVIGFAFLIAADINAISIRRS